jgi:accessory gene regulator B
METLARKLASKIAISLCYDGEREKVVAYGLIALLQMIVTVLAVLLIGLLIGTAIEALILCFSVSILRKFSGGAHAGSILKCMVIAVLYCTAFSAVARYGLSPVVGWIELLIFLILFFAGCFAIVYRRAPVDSPNKPISSESKRLRLRRGTFLVLALYFAFSLLLAVWGKSSVTGRGYCISLLFGILWQVFTLTKLGSRVLTGIENASIF